MMVASEAEDAWWPPTLRPSTFSRRWLALWMVQLASHSTLRSSSARMARSSEEMAGLRSVMVLRPQDSFILVPSEAKRNDRAYALARWERRITMATKAKRGRKTSSKPRMTPKAKPGSKSFRLEEATIDDLHQAIQSGRTTLVGVVEGYLARVRAYNGVASALVTADGAPIPEATGVVRGGKTLTFPTQTVKAS